MNHIFVFDPNQFDFNVSQGGHTGNISSAPRLTTSIKQPILYLCGRESAVCVPLLAEPPDNGHGVRDDLTCQTLRDVCQQDVGCHLDVRR